MDINCVDAITDTIFFRWINSIALNGVKLKNFNALPNNWYHFKAVFNTDGTVTCTMNNVTHIVSSDKWNETMTFVQCIWNMSYGSFTEFQWRNLVIYSL